MKRNFWIKQGALILGMLAMPLLHAMQNRPHITDQNAVVTFRGHESVAMSVAFSPDGSLLASGESDRTVCVWPVTADGTFDSMRQPAV
ncbi:WD40 repeat domain-containing protein, partial [Methylicorpusculum sp.]|uniref:WD40 repeat domain-containing protein n=1 Tax=Methylicorpusculum sp. TaxID=2713644 RepID=UPI002ABBD321